MFLSYCFNSLSELPCLRNFWVCHVAVCIFKRFFCRNCAHAPLDFCNLKYDDMVVVARSTGVVGFG